jgi:hypothetical protein
MTVTNIVLLTDDGVIAYHHNTKKWRLTCTNVYCLLHVCCTIQEHAHAITLATAATNIAQQLQAEAKLIRKQLLKQRDDRITVSLSCPS